jgi:hypothetical protein
VQSDAHMAGTDGDVVGRLTEFQQPEARYAPRMQYITVHNPESPTSRPAQGAAQALPERI